MRLWAPNVRKINFQFGRELMKPWEIIRKNEVQKFDFDKFLGTLFE